MTGRPTPLDEFERQFLAQLPKLRRQAHSFVSHQQVDDLVQDTLIGALAYRDRFDTETDIGAWTYIILRNAALNHHRKARRRGTMLPLDEVVPPSHAPDPATVIMLGEVQQALARLPKRTQAMVLEASLGEDNYSALARQNGISLGAVKHHIWRGRQKLREAVA